MKSKNLIMTTAGGRITCRQCQAKSTRTKLQCGSPAMVGRDVCRVHGGASTGPRTEGGRARCASVRTIHGNETRTEREIRSEKARELRHLIEIGNELGLFAKTLVLRGRKPKN